MTSKRNKKTHKEILENYPSRHPTAEEFFGTDDDWFKCLDSLSEEELERFRRTGTIEMEEKNTQHMEIDMSHLDALLENEYVVSVSEGFETSKEDCQSILYIEAKPEVFQQSKKFNQQASDSIMDRIHTILSDGTFDKVEVFPSK